MTHAVSRSELSRNRRPAGGHVVADLPVAPARVPTTESEDR